MQPFTKDWMDTYCREQSITHLIEKTYEYRLHLLQTPVGEMTEQKFTHYNVVDKTLKGLRNEAEKIHQELYA